MRRSVSGLSALVLIVASATLSACGSERRAASGDAASGSATAGDNEVASGVSDTNTGGSGTDSTDNPPGTDGTDGTGGSGGGIVELVCDTILALDCVQDGRTEAELSTHRQDCLDRIGGQYEGALAAGCGPLAEAALSCAVGKAACIGETLEAVDPDDAWAAAAAQCQEPGVAAADCIESAGE